MNKSFEEKFASEIEYEAEMYRDLDIEDKIKEDE